MDMPGTPDSEDAEQETEVAPREKSRASLFLTANLVFDGSSDPQTVRIRNISAGGMMIDASSARDAGLGVLVTLKNIGDIRGKVIWSTGKRMGISFDNEIDPDLARHKPATVEVPGYNRPYVGSRRPGLAIR